MNCLIIDDEPLAIDVIKTHISRIPFLNLIGETTSAFEALDLLNSLQVDLIFLDIQMPELTGIELLNSINKKPLVIFTTAYPEYALKSYELDAVDYLVKPIPFERLLKAINKAKNRFSPSIKTQPQQESKQEQEYIFVKTEYKSVRINLGDIHFVESMKDYVTFHLNNEKVTSLLSIKNVEQQLPKNRFIRIHRSFIIALDKIMEVERNTLLVKNERLTIGTNYRETVKGLIDKNRLC